MAKLSKCLTTKDCNFRYWQQCGGNSIKVPVPSVPHQRICNIHPCHPSISPTANRSLSWHFLPACYPLPLNQLFPQDNLGPFNLDELFIIVMNDCFFQLLLLLLCHGNGVGRRCICLIVEGAEFVCPHVPNGTTSPTLQLQEEKYQCQKYIQRKQFSL